MQIPFVNPFIQQQFAGTADTTPDGKQAVLIIGDSTCGYKFDNATANPTLTGTAYEYNQGTNSLDAFTSAGLANNGNAGSNKGDQWIAYANAYNGGSGYKPVFVDTHSYGSTLYAASNSNTWYFGSSGGPYTKGTLYTNMKTKADAALTKLGLTKYKFIKIIITKNDLSNATAITDTTACFDQLIQDLRTDFGTDVQINITNGVMSTAAFPSARYQACRSKVIDLKNTYSNVHVSVNESVLYSMGLTDSVTVPLHWTQAGNNQFGAIEAAYDLDTTTTDKDARRVIANMPTPLNATRKAAVVTLFSSLNANSYVSAIDCMMPLRASNVENIYQDFVGMTAGCNGNFGSSGDSAVTFTANDRIGADGTTQHWQTRFAASMAKYAVIGGASSDFAVIFKTGAATTAAGTLATVLGGTNTFRIAFGQSATSLTTRNMNSGTPTTYTDTKIQPNTWYFAGSNGAISLINKNGVDVDSDAQVPGASSSTGLIDLFCRNNANSDTPTERWAGELLFFAFVKKSAITPSTFESIIDTYLTAIA